MTTEARASEGPGFGVPGDVWESLAERVDPAQWRPELAADIETATFPTSDGGSYVMLANPRDLVHYRFTPEEAAILPLLDGEHSIGEIVVEQLDAEGALDVSTVAELVGLLEEGGFLTTPYVDVDAALDRALHPLTLRRRLGRFVRTMSVEWKGAERLVVFLYRTVVCHIFTRVGLVLSALLTIGGVVAAVAVFRQHDHGIHNRSFGVVFVTLMLLDLAIIFIHELGHAAVLVHYGRRVKGAGFRIYFGSPSFFIESSDALMLSRRKRIMQAAAGPGLEVLGTSAASIALWLLPHGTVGNVLFQFVVINYFVLFLNLVPFLELDGYWILSDTLQQPDLRPQSLAFVRHDLWRKLRRRERWSRRETGFALYGTAGVLFTIATFISAFYFWRRVFGDTLLTLWHGGVLGKAGLIIVVSFIAGPAVRGVLVALRALARAIGARVDAYRFRVQSRWRVEAAELLDASGLFGDVPVEVLNDLAGRVRLRPVPRGAAIFRQGDPSDAYYLVRTGRFEVVEEPPGADLRVLRVAGRGEGFGEFGLLEGAPRTATVRAAERGEVYEVDRASFERLLAGRAQIPGFAPTVQQLAELAALPPFAHLDSKQLQLLAEHGRWLTLAPGEVLMEQGEVGDAFYVIASGRLDVIEDGQVVTQRGAGEHVGEIALLLDSPRNATVRTATPARVFRLDREGFATFVAAGFRRGTLRPNVRIDRDWDH